MPGDVLLLDDGRVQLKVLQVQGTKVFTEVTMGGPLSNNKGINKLGGGLSAKALTEKDLADIVASTIWPFPSHVPVKTWSTPAVWRVTPVVTPKSFPRLSAPKQFAAMKPWTISFWPPM